MKYHVYFLLVLIVLAVQRKHDTVSAKMSPQVEMLVGNKNGVHLCTLFGTIVQKRSVCFWQFLLQKLYKKHVPLFLIQEVLKL